VTSPSGRDPLVPWSRVGRTLGWVVAGSSLAVAVALVATPVDPRLVLALAPVAILVVAVGLLTASAVGGLRRAESRRLTGSDVGLLPPQARRRLRRRRDRA
jgi:hypothetical protein